MEVPIKEEVKKIEDKDFTFEKVEKVEKHKNKIRQHLIHFIENQMSNNDDIKQEIKNDE